ncbi:MAG: hypothetical protein ACOCV1_05380 [Bacillota bacterium]
MPIKIMYKCMGCNLIDTDESKFQKEWCVSCKKYKYHCYRCGFAVKKIQKFNPISE